MKNLLFVCLFLSLPQGNAASAAPAQGPTCWETLHQPDSGISSNFGCVLNGSKDDFITLCSADGIGVTNSFRVYLLLRGKYLAAEAEVKAWLAVHPGASQIPEDVNYKLSDAETAWTVAGNKSTIEDTIEAIRRRSVSCK